LMLQFNEQVEILKDSITHIDSRGREPVNENHLWKI
jgi:hypothetical protein